MRALLIFLVAIVFGANAVIGMTTGRVMSLARYEQGGWIDASTNTFGHRGTTALSLLFCLGLVALGVWLLRIAKADKARARRSAARRQKRGS